MFETQFVQEIGKVYQSKKYKKYKLLTKMTAEGKLSDSSAKRQRERAFRLEESQHHNW
jgi:hypothetical protein